MIAAIAPPSFTFHSGYIPILERTWNNEELFTLHSILDIFQYRAKVVCRDGEGCFTFHSGYIPIIVASANVDYFVALHSILDIFQ